MKLEKYIRQKYCDKGITPTEAENLMTLLQQKVYGNKNNKLKIEISPTSIKELNDTVIDFIKRKEKKYTEVNNNNYKTNKYMYYALTLRALQKLKYVDLDGKAINQCTFAKAMELRRPTLCKYYSQLVFNNNDPVYLNIERDLYYI